MSSLGPPRNSVTPAASPSGCCCTGLPIWRPCCRRPVLRSKSCRSCPGLTGQPPPPPWFRPPSLQRLRRLRGGLPAPARGFRPNCLGRRIFDTAGCLLDRVLPPITARQWVASQPHGICWRLAYNGRLSSAVLGCFCACSRTVCACSSTGHRDTPRAKVARSPFSSASEYPRPQPRPARSDVGWGLTPRTRRRETGLRAHRGPQANGSSSSPSRWSSAWCVTATPSARPPVSPPWLRPAWCALSLCRSGPSGQSPTPAAQPRPPRLLPAGTRRAGPPRLAMVATGSAGEETLVIFQKFPIFSLSIWIYMELGGVIPLYA
jgi:hypothetical protein